MQPVTVAISSTGIQYLLQTLLGDHIATALETNLTPPPYSFNVAAFNFLPGGESIEHDYSNITISLSGGSFKSFKPVFSSCVQGPADNSQFAITMTVSNMEVDYNWNEVVHLAGLHLEQRRNEGTRRSAYAEQQQLRV